MSEPTDEEINRVIAEYMGDIWIPEDAEYRRDDKPICEYTTSLDSCVPVVEKLNRELNAETPFATRTQLNITNETTSCLIQHGSNFIARVKGKKSPSRALATACYRVIKELTRSEENE